MSSMLTGNSVCRWPQSTVTQVTEINNVKLQIGGGFLWSCLREDDTDDRSSLTEPFYTSFSGEHINQIIAEHELCTQHCVKHSRDC